MNRRRIYWTLHLGGWTAAVAFFFGLRLVFTAPGVKVTWQEVANWGIYWAFAVGMTHALRGWIQRRGWLDLPFSRTWYRYGIAVVAMGGVLAAQVGSTGLILQALRWKDISQGWLVGMWVNGSFLVLIWLSIYVTAQMVRRYQEAKTRALELELAAEQARLQNLQAQVNPHFLFNSLNSVRALIMEDRDRAAEAVTRLAAILRYSLRSDKEPTVTVAEEMETVTNYLALERMRFEERLRVSLEVDPAAREARIPPLLIQTLVENSLKHGIARLTAGGEVRVEVNRSGADVGIEVRNTGTLAAPVGESGIGLANARERLRLLYGNRARLELSEEAGEVTARVELPYRARESAA